MQFFKIANQHIIYRFSLSFGTKIYHSRQFILFNVHGMKTFNFKNSLTKKYLLELNISLNSKRKNDIVILEADLSNKASYFAKLTTIIFLIRLSFL